MNRNVEYEVLLAELEQTPMALEGTVQRAQARQRKSRRRWRAFGIPAGGLAACFAAFVLLVNLSVPFAQACGNVPVLRELARAVAWSPSLSAAVENDYVQPIGQSQTANGITATIEYVIVDRKQLNIFYTLDYDPALGPLWTDYDLSPSDGSAGDAGGRTEQPGELIEIKRDFVNNDVPGALDLTLSVYAEEQDDGPAAEENVSDGYFDQPVWEEPDYLAELTFHLEFDPYFTAQGTLLELNQTFTLDGQTFTLQEAEIYPTHLRLTLTADPDNTAWLEGLDLYLENEHGERFERSLNGVAATGDPDGEGMGTFWLDSPFFSQGEHLTLHITGARWKDKDAPKIKLNLAEGTAENLPEGVRLLRTERQAEGWIVYMMCPLGEGSRTMNHIAAGGFWDEAGNHYEIWQFGSSYGYWDAEAKEQVGEDQWYTEDFPLTGLEGDVAYLDPTYHRMTNADVVIPLK